MDAAAKPIICISCSNLNGAGAELINKIFSGNSASEKQTQFIFLSDKETRFS